MIFQINPKEIDMKVTRDEAMNALQNINGMFEHLSFMGAMLDDEFSDMDDAMEKICLYIVHSKEIENE